MVYFFEGATVHFVYAKYLAQKFLWLNEENISISEEETWECVSCLSCVGNLVDESEIAHFICDLCFDPQITLPVLKLLTILVGEYNAVCMQVHIWHLSTWMHI